MTTPLARTTDLECHVDGDVLVLTDTSGIETALPADMGQVWRLADGARTVQAIATEAVLSPATVWAHLDVLSDLGLLERHATPPAAGTDLKPLGTTPVGRRSLLKKLGLAGAAGAAAAAIAPVVAHATPPPQQQEERDKRVARNQANAEQNRKLAERRRAEATQQEQRAKEERAKQQN